MNETMNFLFGGWLASLMITMFFYLPWSGKILPELKYRKILKAIRKLNMNEEQSFSVLVSLLNNAILVKPDCLNDISKFYKQLKIGIQFDDVDNKVTQDDIKRVIINMYSNVLLK